MLISLITLSYQLANRIEPRDSSGYDLKFRIDDVVVGLLPKKLKSPLSPFLRQRFASSDSIASSTRTFGITDKRITSIITRELPCIAKVDETPKSGEIENANTYSTSPDYPNRFFLYQSLS
jgi:hypothetical protein